MRVTTFEYRGKRLLDLALAWPATVILSPLLLVIALLVAWRLGRPVLFSQVRPGLGGQPFRLYKFRTMKEVYDARGQPLPDAERVTPFGQWLRSTSLDELPELVNILRGEMSLVGPRPLLMQYLPRYSDEQRRRHNVKPGLTGWAQVQGRNALTWEEKFALDLWYVDHLSLRLDLWILCLTLWKVFRRQGVSQEGHITMTEFMGTPKGQ